MSDKFSKLMQLLIVLRRGKKTTREIADELGIQPRSVRYYIDELLGAHIMVHSVRGPHGGYYIGREYDDWLKLTLNPEELAAIQLGAKQLESSQFVYQREFTSALEKLEIAASQYNKDPFMPMHYISKVTGISEAPDVERAISSEVFEAILKKVKIRIAYYSLNSDKTTLRTVQPYAVFEYKNSLYMVGYCETRCAIIDFKLSRIRQLEKTMERYAIPECFNLSDYMSGSIGIFKDEPLDVELIIRHPMSQIIREKIWVEGQQIEELGPGTIRFAGAMMGYTEVKSWVLGMGSCVTVIGPEKLIEDIRDEAEKIRNNY